MYESQMGFHPDADHWVIAAPINLSHVLVDEQRTLTPIANMEAHGFPMEGIARHVGLKVAVRGISDSGTSRPVFKVRSR